MSESEQTRRVSQAQREGLVKKPYQKPEVRYESVFETMALACGKIQTTQSACHANRKSS